MMNMLKVVWRMNNLEKDEPTCKMGVHCDKWGQKVDESHDVTNSMQCSFDPVILLKNC